ncbi:MAG TPA: 5-(carboxyamino)imidazole ribonucleotide mutase [Bacillota bacterium]|nr:5-(carboxyamino)imidazole ribonucleotide mutase [Candidatus Fermentithermobacillaceae bacterium]HOB30375.1 5-(carboxyamino)imidazole ribonucleotide mutase [Bacillota bacterium]HOK64376.1 5-(carboxyamino)imidazole ribonucleotide mutase [Bacillota bacterium]HOL11977.1 5-(carboxyamino)imidazole ribonucleotide mutase [Bacillota bacterium]HOQ02984.1 5-(carboxyamino)imidazole ribonucleotide mutase [Bacillota bacterium]
MGNKEDKIRVGVVLGSVSDIGKVKDLFQILDEFEVRYELAIISAHRTHALLEEYARSAVSRSIEVIIAAAGLSAALPGVLAALVDIPVIGIPVSAGPLNGVDALLSIAQMPPGIPVATVGIDGSKNAGLLAVRILALTDDVLGERLVQYKKDMADGVLKKALDVKKEGYPIWEI